MYSQRGKIINSVLEGKNAISKGTVITGSSLGFGTYIGEECRIKDTSIGKYSSLGSGIKILGGHPIDRNISLYPGFFDYGNKYKQIVHFKTSKLHIDLQVHTAIGSDVWIGDDVKIMAGVTIGDGAIIGAGAIVTKNVRPYAIVAGSPAKLLRFRFSAEVVEFLEDLQWWNMDENWLVSNANLFADSKEFMEKIKK